MKKEIEDRTILYGVHRGFCDRGGKTCKIHNYLGIRCNCTQNKSSGERIL